AADEVADLGNPGGAGRKGLGQHHHRDDFDRPVAVPVVPVRHSLSPSHSPASTTRCPRAAALYAGYAALPGTGRHLGLILLAVLIGRGWRPSWAAAPVCPAG